MQELKKNNVGAGMLDRYRPVKIDNDCDDKTYLFHCWAEHSMAILEDENGRCSTYSMSDIKFIDVQGCQLKTEKEND
jgi:hypothetical protein